MRIGYPCINLTVKNLGEKIGARENQIQVITLKKCDLKFALLSMHLFAIVFSALIEKLYANAIELFHFLFLTPSHTLTHFKNTHFNFM